MSCQRHHQQLAKLHPTLQRLSQALQSRRRLSEQLSVRIAQRSRQALDDSCASQLYDLTANTGTYSMTSLYILGQSDTLPYKERMYMKSKLFLGYVHSLQASSTSNRRFGGTSRGCVGDRSVPRTWQLGYMSAKSLDRTHQF